MIVPSSQLVMFLLGFFLSRELSDSISDYGKTRPVGDVHTMCKLSKLICNSHIKLNTSKRGPAQNVLGYSSAV